MDVASLTPEGAENSGPFSRSGEQGSEGSSRQDLNTESMLRRAMNAQTEGAFQIF